MAKEMDSDGEEAAAAAATATTEGQGTSWAQSGCAVLRRGWWLGKKVAIAGVAITSAPVLIPPLLLFSTLGVALSLPFGVYYASYTATEKVMRSLLPLPSLQTQDAEVEESEDEMELRFQFFKSWEDGGVMLVEREDIYSEDDVGVLPEDEDGDQIEDLSFNSEEGVRDTAKEVEIRLSCLPSLATAVGGQNEQVNEAEETINAEEEELYPEEEELPPEVMNQIGGSIKMVGEEKPIEIATAIGGDNEAIEKRPPNTCMVGMLPKVSEGVIEPSSVGVQYTSIGEKWNEGSILTSENAEPRVEDIGKERESKVGAVDSAAAKVKEPLQEEHKLESGPSASEQSGNQSGLEMDDVCTIPGSENLQNDKDQKYTEMDDGQNKYMRNMASKEIEAAMENSAGAVSEHGIVMDHPNSQEYGGGIVVGEEKLSRSQGGGSISKEQEAGEIGSEVSLRMEYPSISDEKRNEGSKQILVKPKALEETRDEREESEGESVQRTVTGVKLSQENKIEGEPIVVEQSAKEGWITMQENKIEGESIAIEQSAKEGWITMMEEERSVQEQSQVEQKREKEKGPGPTAAELESEGEPTALSSEYVSAVEDQFSDQFSDVGEADSRGSMERGMGIRFGHEMVGSNREVAASSDDEVLYNAQQMWEQIIAIRTIVGYKSVLHSSLVAELKSLYVFTGVEPPVSFNDTSDHAEVISNLRFLKSVIGVL